MLGDPCEPRDPWGGSPAMGCLVPRARESGSFSVDTQDGSQSNDSSSPLFIVVNSLFALHSNYVVGLDSLYCL